MSKINNNINMCRSLLWTTIVVHDNHTERNCTHAAINHILILFKEFCLGRSNSKNCASWNSFWGILHKSNTSATKWEKRDLVASTCCYSKALMHKLAHNYNLCVWIELSPFKLQSNKHIIYYQSISLEVPKIIKYHFACALHEIK